MVIIRTEKDHFICNFCDTSTHADDSRRHQGEEMCIDCYDKAVEVQCGVNDERDNEY